MSEENVSPGKCGQGQILENSITKKHAKHVDTQTLLERHVPKTTKYK